MPHGNNEKVDIIYITIYVIVCIYVLYIQT